MRKITVQHYAAVLESWSSQFSFDAVKPRLTALAKWMRGHGQAGRLSNVARAWHALRVKNGVIVEVELTTPNPFDARGRQEVVKTLERQLGKKIILIEKVKPELLGGAQVRILDRQWDGSIQEQLHQLHLTLLR